MTRTAARRTARSTLAVVLALATAGGIALTAAPAAAQIAAALGKPLPSPDLPVGTVVARIVAGSPASPVVGTEVTLVVNGTPREARTDSAGRASFAGLPAGAKVLAKVLDEDKAEKASDEFPIPDSGGVRVLISTKPWQGGAGGAPFAGGAGGAGMPEPRSLSGQARGDQSDPSGQLTARVTYNSFQDTPEGVQVALVGYSADDTVSYQVLTTDKAGRVQFQDLDRSGGTSYFAMALLPRNGAVDRLSSEYILLDSQVGQRLALSSEKRDSTAAAIDDYAKMDPQVDTPAGKVRVVLEGYGDRSSTVALIDAATRKPIGEAQPELAPADPSRVRAEPQFEADASLPAGTLDVVVVGGAGRTEQPLKDIAIRVLPASSNDATGGLASVTGADGTVRMALPATEPQKVVVTINGRELVSQPLDLSKSGGKLGILAHWEATGRPQAMFDVTRAPGQVIYAECTWKGQHFRSMPVQLLDAKGTKLTIFVFPRVAFTFQLEGEAEDDRLAMRGRFEVRNYSFAPYRAGPDGLVVPLPKGFTGAVVADTDQAEVSVSAGEGLRIIRPLPPVGRQFHAGFYVPVEAGKAAWSLDLPYGTQDSELVFKQTPGMTLQTPPGFHAETRTVPSGTFYLLAPLQIDKGQAMVMSLDGLPSSPGWRKWLQGVIGVAVVGVMLGGLALALFGRKRAGGPDGPDPADESRRQRLLDELVELERSGANPRRREQLLEELERLWG